MAAILLAGPAQGADPEPSTDPGSGRPDEQYPYPPLEPAVSEVPGIEIAQWGYRFTNPGSPDNSALIQAVVENVSQESRSGLFLAGLEYGVPWIYPSPVWFRVDMRLVELEPGEKRTITVEFPQLQSIHIGVKSKFYNPKVLVKDPADYLDDSNTVEGVKIMEWNYTMVARPRQPQPAKFDLILRNFDGEAKDVTVRAELIPRPDSDGYTGPPEGFHEDHVVPIEKGEEIAFASIPLLSVSGLPRYKAEEYFDASVRILGVERK